jgi:hypothetical protein
MRVWNLGEAEKAGIATTGDKRAVVWVRFTSTGSRGREPRKETREEEGGRRGREVRREPDDHGKHSACDLDR